MRGTLVVLGAFLLASLGISSAKPDLTQEKAGSADSKMTPEDAAKKNPVASTPGGLGEVRKLYGYKCAICHGETGAGKADLAADMKLEPRHWRKPNTLGKGTVV